MTENFWQHLRRERPFILAASPMDGLSDHPFRAMTKKYGRPDVLFTEFANVEGLCHNAARILRHFDFTAEQQPLVAQLFGKTPAAFYQVAILLCEYGVRGIDINMGCPARTVASHGSGAALIKTPELAQEIVRAVQAGIKDWQEGKNSDDCPDLSAAVLTEAQRRKQKFRLPAADRHQSPAVSIKTRIGYAGNEVRQWLPYLLELQPAALSVHGRSFKQRYSGQANWQSLAEAAELNRRLSPSTIFLGNGDIENYEMAAAYVKRYGMDGVLIGRAVLGNPLVFLAKKTRQTTLAKLSLLDLALEHAQLYEASYSQEERYTFLPMRKHLACYTKGIKDARQLRLQLIKSNSAADVAAALAGQTKNKS